MKTASQRFLWPDVIICTGGLLVLLAFVIPSLSSFSLTSDEGWLLRAARDVVTTHEWNSYDSVRHPPLSFYTYGFFLNDESTPQENLVRSRMLMLIYPLLLGVLIFVVARKHLGRMAAAAALVLYATHPNLLAHASLITTDVCAAATFFAAFIACTHALKSGSVKSAVVAGFLLGVALLAKYTAILLVPLILLMALGTLFRKKTNRGETDRNVANHNGTDRNVAERNVTERNVTDRKATGRAWPCWRTVIIIFVAALLLLNMGYGFDRWTGADYEARSSLGSLLTWSCRTVPLVPAPYIMGMDRVLEVMELGHPAYFLGKFTLENRWYFYPVAFLLKEPLAFLILLCAGLAFLWKRRELRFYLVAVGVPLISFLFINDNFVGLRHLLVIYPFLFVISAIPFAVFRRRRLWLWTLPVLQATSTLFVAPHYLAYFNEAAGGPEAGSRYLLDSNYDWGQDYDAVVETMNSKPYLLKDSPGPIPTLGHVAVSPMDLEGYPGTWPGHDWLEGIEPVERIGFTWRIYDVKLEDFEGANPASNPERTRLGWFQHESSRLSEALALFKASGCAAGEAHVLLDQGKLEEARIVCEAAPQTRELARVHALVQEVLGNHNRAERLYLSGMALDVENAYLDRPPSLALETYARNDDALSLNNYGYLLWKSGELETAARMFRLATEKDPLFADPWGNLAAVSAHLCERELLREYEPPQGNVDRGKADPSKRAAYAAAALSFRDQYYQLLTQPNAWWAKRVHYRKHVVIYPQIFALPLPGPNALKRLADRRPLLFEDLVVLGRLYVVDDDFQHAARALLAARGMKNDDSRCLHSLGIVHFRNRLYQLARADLTEALNLDPDDPEIRASLDYLKKYTHK